MKTYHDEMADHLKLFVPKQEDRELILLHSRTLMKYKVFPMLMAGLRESGYTDTHNRKVLTWLIELFGMIDLRKIIKKGEVKNEFS